MASTTETGHAKNVANFDELITFATSYGATYNPSKPTLKLDALKALSTSAKNALGAVNTASSASSNAIASREVAFKPLNKLTTRVMNALRATDTTEQVDDSAQTLARKIQGSRATAKKTDEQKAQAKAEGNEITEISTSQMSYDSRLDNFDKLIKLLASVSLYAPNEAELKVTALTALYTDLKTKNTAVVNTAVALSNARIVRDDVFYKPNTGLVDVALDTKVYIKSLYGASSPQYKQVSKIPFRAVKI